MVLELNKDLIYVYMQNCMHDGRRPQVLVLRWASSSRAGPELGTIPCPPARFLCLLGLMAPVVSFPLPYLSPHPYPCGQDAPSSARSWFPPRFFTQFPLSFNEL